MKYLPYVLSAMVAGVLSVSCSEENNPVVAVEPTAEEGFIEINGGGASFPNMVFVNLSEEEQVAVPRESWDLSFTNGSGFEVLINGTTGAMAYPTGKQTFEEVEAETMEMLRTEGKLVLDFNNMVSRRYVDDPNNPWRNGTAIQPVSANSLENQVYIYSRGESGAAERPWVLLRVDRESNAYRLTYKEMGGAERSAVIAKGSDTHMNYFSFTTDAVVEVEPARKKWDFVWTAGTNEIRFPAGENGIIAYFFQDLVLHNIQSEVGIAMVMEEAIPYEDFAASDLTGLSLTTDNRLAMGANWRGGGGPNQAPTMLDDRYFIVKDAQGNHYKLRWVSLTRDGERGRPSFEYALVQAAE